MSRREMSMTASFAESGTGASCGAPGPARLGLTGRPRKLALDDRGRRRTRTLASLEANASVTRGRAGSPLCEWRTGLRGPTALGGPGAAPDATRPVTPAPLVNDPD